MVDAAWRVFAEHGFAGTSISALLEATGLSRASLYGAFGDKEGLFRAALDAYGARIDRALSARQAVLPPLHAFLLANLDVTCDKGLGCLVGQASDELENLPEQTKSGISSTLTRTRVRVREIVEQAQQQGEIAAHLDPGLIAGMVLVFQRGLAGASKQELSREELDRQVACFLQMMRTAEPAPR